VSSGLLTSSNFHEVSRAVGPKGQMLYPKMLGSRSRRRRYPTGPDPAWTPRDRELAEQSEGLAGWIEENLPRVAQSRANHGKAKRSSG
jgi:hypothetical protein